MEVLNVGLMWCCGSGGDEGAKGKRVYEDRENMAISNGESPLYESPWRWTRLCSPLVTYCLDLRFGGIIASDCDKADVNDLIEYGKRIDWSRRA